MTLPRAVFPGRFLFITRSCTHRQFLLRPDPVTSNAYLYCIAEAAKAFDMNIILSQMMPNHEHTLLYDPHGHEVGFRQRFHKNLATAQNARLGRWENFWKVEQSCVIEVLTLDDVLEKLIYIATNPVKDWLVEKVHHWPGPRFTAALLSGKPMRARRPPSYFSANGTMPEEVEISMKLPDHLSAEDKKTILDGLRAGIAAVERKFEAERRATGRCVLGRNRVLRQPWTSSPEKPQRRRGVKPTVASLWKYLRMKQLQRNKEWQLAYRTARASWLAGLPAEFPYGTYWLARCAKVNVQAQPASC